MYKRERLVGRLRNFANKIENMSEEYFEKYIKISDRFEGAMADSENEGLFESTRCLVNELPKEDRLVSFFTNIEGTLEDETGEDSIFF